MRTLAVLPLSPDGSPPDPLLDPTTPAIPAIDQAVVRGDAVFETIGVDRGTLRDLDAHLARLERSARMLDLPQPDLRAWRTAVERAAALLPEGTPGSVRLVLSRGLEGSSMPTGWLTVAEVDRDYAGSPVRVVLLERGQDSGLAERAPWLLAGAKTVSYAINMAAGREAARRGADDAVFVTSDGFVLEAPTSTVILREGDVLVTPDPGIGILPGTTQAHAFEVAERLGLAVRREDVAVDRLLAADAAWLASSVRLLAPVTEIDGAGRSVDAGLTAQLNDGLRASR